MSKTKAKQMASKFLIRSLRRAELHENAERLYIENAARIAEEISAEDIELVLEELKMAQSPLDVAPEATFAHRSYEWLSGTAAKLDKIIFGELNKLVQGPALSRGFRRSELRGVEAAVGVDGGSDETVAVNWMPTGSSSTVVGCKITIVWFGDKDSPGKPDIVVFYDNEAAAFELNMKSKKAIEILVDAPNPATGSLEGNAEDGYILKLFST